MSVKPLAAAALGVLFAAVLAPAPSTAVQRTVLVEETGWMT